MENSKLFNFQRFYCDDCDIVYSVDDLMEKTDHSCPVCGAEPSKKFLNDLTVGRKVTFIAKEEMTIPKYDVEMRESEVPLFFKKGQSIFGYVKRVFFEKEMGGSCVELSIGSLGVTILPLVDFYMDKEYLKETIGVQSGKRNYPENSAPADKYNQKYRVNVPVKSVQKQYELDTERYRVFINKYDSDSKVDALLITLRSLGIKERNISQVIGIVNKDLGF